MTHTHRSTTTSALPSRRAVLLGMAALPLAACAPGGSGESGGKAVKAGSVETDISKAGKVTLTVWDQEVRSGQDKPLSELNDAFMAKYPNVTIDRVSRSFSDLQKQVRLAITSNKAPDVVQANNARADMGAFVKAGLLVQLDGYAEVYGWNQRFPSSVRSVASYSETGEVFGKGHLYGIPLTGEMIGIWYNKQKLRALGAQPPTTWEAFTSALDQAKKAGEVPIQYGNLDQWPGIHEFGFVQDMFTPRDQVIKLGFGQPGAAWDTPTNVEAAATLQQWAQQGYFPQGFNGLGYDPSWQNFAKGEGVFLVSGTWLLADLEGGMGGNLGFAAPPVGPVGERAAMGATGLPFAITSASSNPDVAAAYLDFITSTDAMTRFTDAGGLPVYGLGAQQPSGTQADMFTAWSTVVGEDALTPYLDWSTPDAAELLPQQVQELTGGDTTPQEFVATLQDDYQSFVG